VGLLIPAMAPVAAACPAALLIVQANIRTACEHLTIGGRPVTAFH
jgi:hypothetical protein